MGFAWTGFRARAGSVLSGRRARGARLHPTSFGTVALVGAGTLKFALQLALLPILARLIGPEEYGLVGLAVPFALFVNMMADGGVSYALSRERNVTAEQESTGFWLAAAIGAACATICCLAAWPMGVLLSQPRLPLLIVALAPIMVLNGLSAVSGARLSREGRFSFLAAIETLSNLVSIGVAIAAAASGLGAWSLVAQQFALFLCRTSSLYLASKIPIKWEFRVDQARSLLRFGVNTTGAGLVDHISRNIDNLIIGAILGVTNLGYYAMAYQIARIPDMLIAWPLHRYVFRAVSRASHDAEPETIRRLSVASLGGGAVVLAPLFCGLATTADIAVALVLGDQWTGAVAPLRWLAAAGFMFGVSSIVAVTVSALGHSRLQLRLSAFSAIVTIVVVAVSGRFGIAATSASLAVGVTVACGLYLHQLARCTSAPLQRLFGAFRPALCAALVMAATILGLREPLEALPLFLGLPLLLGIGTLAYGAVIWGLFRSGLAADLRVLVRAQGDIQPDPAPFEGERASHSAGLTAPLPRA